MENKEKILCAGIYCDDKKIYVGQPTNINSGIVFLGWRHHCCLGIIYDLGFSEVKYQVQGFLTSKNRFVSREEAYWIAREADQCSKKNTENPYLTSEDLY